MLVIMSEMMVNLLFSFSFAISNSQAFHQIWGFRENLKLLTEFSGDSLANTDALGEESNDSDQKHMGFMVESVDEDLIL